jgi:hypothetical protein
MNEMISGLVVAAGLVVGSALPSSKVRYLVEVISHCGWRDFRFRGRSVRTRS